MITHVPGFHLFFCCFFASFCIGQISHKQHKDKVPCGKMLSVLIGCFTTSCTLRNEVKIRRIIRK